MNNTINSCLLIGTFLVFLAVNTATAQVIQYSPVPKTYLYYSGVASPSYVPAPSIISYRSAIIQVTYTGTWTPAAMAAFNFAANIWQQHLTSDEPILVTANMAALGIGALGAAGPHSLFRNFGSSEPCYDDDIWYPSALADKLADADQQPGQSDIDADFTTNAALQPLGISWYFGTDGMPGPNQIDFVSVVLHELGHGLGFFSSARNNAGSLQHGFGGFPVVFDRFIADGTGTFMTTLASPSVPLTAFLQSNGVVFTGFGASGANGGTPPRLFAPNPFQPGSSISHLDEAAFPPGNVNALMTPFLGAQEANHNVGVITHALMEDMCWTLDFPVGIEDEIKITSGPTTLPQGAPFTYTAQFYDEYPYGDYIPYNQWNWEMTVYHSLGSIVYKSSYHTNSGWTSNLGYLPWGYTWTRNTDGSVKAKVKVFATDNHGYYHEDDRYISILAPPDQPIVYLRPQRTEVQCNPTIEFYAPGATSYQIFWDFNSGHPYFFSTSVPGNVNSYTFNNLWNGVTYFFNVRAVNSSGTSPYGNEVSAYVHCGVTDRDQGQEQAILQEPEKRELTLQIFPNPASSMVTISGSKPIQRLIIFNQLGQTVKNINLMQPTLQVDIPVSYIENGIYQISVIGEAGDKTTTKFIKI